MTAPKHLIEESIAFFLAERNPTLSPTEIITLMKRAHKVDITVERVEQVREEFEDLVEEYRRGGEKSIRKGIQLGQLPYASLYDRVKALGDIVKLAKDGYSEDRISPRGEIVNLVVRNLPAATAALEATHRMLESLNNEGTEDDWDTLVAAFSPEEQKLLRVYSPNKN